MAQDLTTVSIESFRLQMPRMSTGVLSDLFFRISLWKRNNADKTSDEKLLDMIRKQAAIRRELTYRGITRTPEFQAWKTNMERNLTKDGRIYRRKMK